MTASIRDFSVLNKFNLERKPVGIKFLPSRPDNITHLEKALNFCEMVKEAHTSAPFYVTKGDFHCVEPMLLGMEDPEPAIVSGLFGVTGGLFKEARARPLNLSFSSPHAKGSSAFGGLLGGRPAAFRSGCPGDGSYHIPGPNPPAVN